MPGENKLEEPQAPPYREKKNRRSRSLQLYRLRDLRSACRRTALWARERILSASLAAPPCLRREEASAAIRSRDSSTRKPCVREDTERTARCCTRLYQKQGDPSQRNALRGGGTPNASVVKYVRVGVESYACFPHHSACCVGTKTETKTFRCKLAPTITNARKACGAIGKTCRCKNAYPTCEGAISFRRRVKPETTLAPLRGISMAWRVRRARDARDATSAILPAGTHAAHGRPKRPGPTRWPGRTQAGGPKRPGWRRPGPRRALPYCSRRGRPASPKGTRR